MTMSEAQLNSDRLSARFMEKTAVDFLNMRMQSFPTWNKNNIRNIIRVSVWALNR